MNRTKLTLTILSGFALFLVFFYATIKPAKAGPSVSVWWPVNNASMIGHQPFKAIVDGMNLSDYKMFWQVDNGGLNPMSDNFTDYPHKEADVDLTNWTWRGSGPYEVNFVAKDNSGNTINQSKVSINIPQSYSSPSPTPVPATLSPTKTPTSTPTPTPSGTSVTPTLRITGLYVDPNNQNITVNSYLKQKIETQPQAKWFGNWNSNITTDVRSFTSGAQAVGAIPVLVAYNIPQRDCGGYSAGGSSSFDAYRNWINSFANGITGNPIVILEPDSLANMDCLNTTDQNARLSLLSFAVSALKNHGAKVYLDAGHPGWHSAEIIANRLKSAGGMQSDGFSLNVSNFISTTDNVNYGHDISGFLGGKHFVIDTSRNGVGPTADYAWCNPSGRALGEKPALFSQGTLDGYLWIKRPGESDGNCNGGPSAGTFWDDYALGLASRASW